MSTSKRINFVRGVPADEAFPRGQIEDCAKSVTWKNDPAGLRYGDAAGPLAMREWVAREHDVAVDRVMLGNGSLGLFDLLLRSEVKGSGALMIEEPCYDRIIDAAKLAGIEVRPVRMERGRLDFDEMRAHLRDGRVRFFYCVPDFQNPTGSTYPLAVRETLISLARDYGFGLVEDSPYRRLRYDGADEPSLLSLAPDVTLHLTSFSKIIAPGLRAAYAVGPSELIFKMRALAESIYVTPGNYALAIAGEWLARDWLPVQIKRLSKLYRPRRDAMIQALAQNLPEAEFECPSGGFFVGVQLSSRLRLDELCDALARDGIDLQGGDNFFVRTPAHTFLRLPFCSMTEQEIAHGIALLGSYLADVQTSAAANKK